MWGAISALLTTARLALLPPILGGTPRRFVAIMNDDGPEAMEEVRQLAEEEKIKVFINRTYDFEDVPKVSRCRRTDLQLLRETDTDSMWIQAYEEVMSRTVLGKLIVDVQSPL